MRLRAKNSMSGLSGLTLALAALGGCGVGERPLIQPAAAERPGSAASLPADPLSGSWKKTETWPRRWGWWKNPAAPNERPDAALLGVIEPVTGRLMPMRREDEVVKQVEREMQADISSLIASRQSRTWTPLTVVGEGKGAFVFVSSPDQDRTGDRPGTWPTFSFKFISGSRGAINAQDVVQVQRTWFSFYDAVPGVPQRGMAVVLPGIFGTPFGVVDQTVQNLRAHGWSVLRMLAHPSRFTEQVSFNIPSAMGAADTDRWGEVIASVYGERIAECAYAVEAAARHVEKMRPALAGAPRLALGMSGGAMVLPTVVAYRPEAYCGAVLIAGGVDFLSVTATSNYAERIDALKLRFDGSETPPKGRMEELSRSYLRAAPLDALYTIESLQNKPVLLVHARGDEAVPSRFGDELWNRAGNPQRWVYDGGHEALFISLPWQLDDIMAWIDTSVPGRLAGEFAKAPERKPKEQGTP